MKLTLNKVGNTLIPFGSQNTAKLAALPDGEYQVEIGKVETRRAAQNRLLWDIYTSLSKTSQEAFKGLTKEDWHRRMKIDYLVPIYIRDDAEYAEMFSALEMVLQECGRATYDKLYEGIIKETSTTTATVKQFSEYLSDIIHFARFNGVVLKIDEYLFEMAKIYNREGVSDA